MLTIIAAMALAAAGQTAPANTPAQPMQMGQMEGMDMSHMDHSRMDHSKMTANCCCCCDHMGHGKRAARDKCSASEHQNH